MKIALFELEDWEKKFIKKELGEKNKLVFCDDGLDEGNVSDYKGAEGIVVFIYSVIDKKVLASLPNLKFIATMSTGYDHIDLVECKKRGIKVSNVPFYGENTVAEHTFALILALSRKIFHSIEHTKREDFSLEGLRGFDLKNRTMGVIGTGHIGKNVIKMARAFDMNVVAYDPYPDKKAAEKMKYTYVSLSALLKSSDVVTLHAPYNKKTHHIINKRNIKKAKKGSILVNTARGGLIDTDALVYGLSKEILSGIGLDVLEEELMIKEEKQLLNKKFSNEDLKTAIQNHILLHDDRVIITPHNAFNSEEALQRILDTTIENVEGFLNKKIVNLVK